MNKVVGTWNLCTALKAEGYVLPDETADVHLELPVDGIVQLVIRINMTDVTLAQLGRALIRLAEDK